MYNPGNSKFSGKRSFILTNVLLLFFFSGISQSKDFSQSLFTLDLNGGMTIPVSDFKNYADNGFQAGLMLNRTIYKNLSLGITTNYRQLNVKETVQSPDKSWSSISLGIGPQYTIPLNQFFLQFHGNLGINFINSPAINQQQPGKPDYFDEGDMTVFQLEGGQTASLYAGGGFKTGINLSDKIRLFAGTAYSTDLNKTITYEERDLSHALHPSGEVYVDVIKSTPFEKKHFSFSDLGINLGLSINLGNTSAKRQVQDYNSSRSNKPSPIRRVEDNGTDSVPGKRQVQDYNSSRSNKPSPIRRVDDIGTDSVHGKRQVQDYNSSRSNKPSPIRRVDGNGTDSVPGKRQVQDYNSSRSNKPSPIRRVDNNVKDSVPGKRQVQDYNSSRSNKPAKIRRVDNNETDSIPGKRQVQDYNSSRSNKPSSIRRVGNNRTDSVPGKRQVQDYNSSRSNKPSPIRRVDDIGNDSVPGKRQVQDYNSSRSNKPAKIRRVDKDKKDSVPKSKKKIKRRNSG